MIWDFVKKAGLLYQGWFFLGLAAMPMDLRTSILHWSAVASIVFVCTNDNVTGDLIVAEQPPDKCFGCFAGLEKLLYVLVNRFTKFGRSDLVKDHRIYSVVNDSTDSPWALRLAAQKSCSTTPFSVGRIVVNAFATWKFTKAAITACSAVTIKSYSSSGAGAGSTCGSSAPWEWQLASLLLPAFRIISQALVRVASFLYSIGTSQWANISCAVDDHRRRSRSSWKCLSAVRERIDVMMLFLDIVCTTTKWIEEVL